MSFGSGYPLMGGMRWLRPALSGMLFLVAGAIAVVEVAADSGKKAGLGERRVRLLLAEDTPRAGPRRCSARRWVA